MKKIIIHVKKPTNLKNILNNDTLILLLCSLASNKNKQTRKICEITQIEIRDENLVRKDLDYLLGKQKSGS